MAGIFQQKLELPTTPIEELLKSNDKQRLERYFNHSNKESYSSLPWMDVTTIDLQLLLDSSSLKGEEELYKLKSALSTWGCFQLINHGITSSKLDQVRKMCKEFFALPLVEKKKYSRTRDRIEGYGNDIMAPDQAFNWNDRLIIKIYPVDQRNPKFWPENPPKFSEVLEEYAADLNKVREILLKVTAKILNLEENKFFSEYGEKGTMVSRFNSYPACPCPDQVIGLKPHSDINLFTILLQDKDVEGLHVEKDNQWFRVPIIPDALVVNAADLLEILSNGILKSAFHRAVVDKERERISVAVAFGMPPEKEIEPLKELISKERPQLYKKVKNYASLTIQLYARGERAINAVKI